MKFTSLTRKQRRTAAILLSLLVYPGLGQCVQRRWIAATTIIIAFTASAGWAFVEITLALWHYYDFAFHAASAAAVNIDTFQLLLPLLLSAAIWIANLVDVVAGRAK